MRHTPLLLRSGANGGAVVTEFVGIAAAADLFGISRYLSAMGIDLLARAAG
jgi:hypothetical protein